MSKHDNLKDPDIIAAADEIIPILKKHNLMGVVFLASRDRTAFVHEMSPPWSCITMEEDVIRVRATREDFPSQEARELVVSDSIGGLMGILRCSEDVFQGIKSLLRVLSTKVDITHVDHDRTGESVPIK